MQKVNSADFYPFALRWNGLARSAAASTYVSPKKFLKNNFSPKIEGNLRTVAQGDVKTFLVENYYHVGVKGKYSLNY